jgi:hypothetical protein
MGAERKAVTVTMVGDGTDIFVILDGMKIAKRENKAWTSLIPGYKVRDIGDLEDIEVVFDPVLT